MAFCWVFDLLRQTAKIFDLLPENSRQTANSIVNSKFEFQVKLRLRIRIWAFEEIQVFFKNWGHRQNTSQNGKIFKKITKIYVFICCHLLSMICCQQICCQGFAVCRLLSANAMYSRNIRPNLECFV